MGTGTIIETGEIDMTLTNYWWLLLWIFFGGGFLTFFVSKKDEIVTGVREKRWRIWAALLTIIPYIVWAGFRSDSYGDTYIYRKNFLEAPDQLSSLAQYINEATKDKGFAAFTVIFKSIFGSSDILFFIVIAAIQLIIFALICRKYSSNYWISIFLFAASSEYMSWCHNGIRQFLAVTIIFAATPWLLKKKYAPLICLILVASILHASALLMVPIIFIVQGKAWNKKTLLCIAASVVVLMFVNQFTDVLDLLMSNTQYSNMVTEWKEWQDNGTNPIRVLVYSVPMILSIVGFRQINSANNNLVNILTNFSILTCAIALVSMVTSGIFIGRLIIYPAMYSTFLLLPWEIEHLFTRASTQLIKSMMVVAYIGFFFYQMHMTWGLI